MAFNPEGSTRGMSQNEANAWDTLAKLNKDNPDEPRFEGTDPWDKSPRQKKFEAEAKEFREIGEKTFPYLSNKAKEAYKIRDGQDFGEMLHEQKSWEDNIDREVRRLDSEVDKMNDGMSTAARDIGQVDVFSGEATSETVISFPSEERDAFQHSFMVASNLDYICDHTPALGYALETMVMLATDMDPESIDDSDAHTGEALKYQSQKAWLAEYRQNEEARKELEKTPAFYHIQRLIELRKEKMNGDYEEDYSLPDPTDNSLYKRINLYLTEREKADKGPENAVA